MNAAAQPLQAESLGKILPRILLPYAQQWAERAGLPFLSRLLVDEQVLELVERYGDEVFAHFAQAQASQSAAPGRTNGRGALYAVPEPADAEADAELDELRVRLRALQGQHEMLLGMLNTVRSKIRPLASGLGCCPECLVGVIGCPKCAGRSAVGYYEPDPELLESQVLKPLAARGVPLAIKDEPSATRKRSRQWPTK